jgi:hypothetical protein
MFQDTKEEGVIAHEQSNDRRGEILYGQTLPHLFGFRG